MANVIDIIMRGKNEASAAIKQVKGDLTGLDGAATSATGGLSMLGKAIPWVALGTFALKAGETIFALNEMREQSAQLEARFVGFTGGVQKADAAFKAMDATLGNALSRDEKMTAATQLLGLGIAKTAQEAATLTNQALIMGMSVEELTRALETGRVTGLVQYGISVSDVKTRTDALQKANANLSDTEARSIAIKEQLATKSFAIAEAGGQAATATERMGNALDTLKDNVADLINIEGAINKITASADGLSIIISGFNAAKGVFEFEPGSDAQLKAITDRLEYLRDLMARSAAGENIYRFSTTNAQKEIADLESKLIALTPANEAAAASSGVAAVRMVDAAREVQGAIGDVNSELSGSSPYWDAWAGFAENAAQRASNAAYAARSAMGQVAAAATTTGTFTEPSKTRGGLWTDWAKKQVSSSDAGDLVNQWQERMAAANKDIAGRAGTDYASAMREAARQVQGDIEGALSGAVSASKGLFDFTGGAGDMFKPGSNGPFEAIYRAQAVAVGGIETDQERQWAEMYGLTPESAARIVADFQRGLFSPEVQGLINVDQLVGQIQGEQAAADSKSAFANMIAGKLGVKDAGALVASQTFQAISGGVEADPTQQADAAQKVLDAYLNNVNAVVTGKDYAGRMIAFGSTTWVYYEQGLLEGAKESAVFAAAVDAAIGAWMARQAAPKSQSGVVGAANAMGVTP